MIKKSICLGLILMAAAFAFAACGFGSQVDTLEQYKADQKAELVLYAEEKGKDSYTDNNWITVGRIVEAGKIMIDNAADENAVDSAVEASMAKIDQIPQGQSFYSLEEAFEEGLLTTEDLRNISYYYNSNGGIGFEGFVPSPKNPEVLSAKTAMAIREAYLREDSNIQRIRNQLWFLMVEPDLTWDYLDSYVWQPTIDRTWVSSYFGTYGDCVIVSAGYDDGSDSHVPFYPEYEIGGVIFYNYPHLSVWIGGEVCNYEEKQIASIHYYTNYHTNESWIPWQDHKYYDFEAMTYSTKRIASEYYAEWEGERDEYAVIATFSEEQAKAFFERLIEIGIFDMDSKYHSSDEYDIYDGSDWKLIITFSDGTTFESVGYRKYPEQEETLNDAFLLLTGYRLFSSLWWDSQN